MDDEVERRKGPRETAGLAVLYHTNLFSGVVRPDRVSNNARVEHVRLTDCGLLQGGPRHFSVVVSRCMTFVPARLGTTWESDAATLRTGESAISRLKNGCACWWKALESLSLGIAGR
jgi:hypothetical protein